LFGSAFQTKVGAFERSFVAQATGALVSKTKVFTEIKQCFISILRCSN